MWLAANGVVRKSKIIAAARENTTITRQQTNSAVSPTSSPQVQTAWDEWMILLYLCTGTSQHVQFTTVSSFLIYFQFWVLDLCNLFFSSLCLHVAVNINCFIVI
jgi:hypothetical protein